MSPESIATLLINLQIGESLILPTGTTLEYVERAIEAVGAHTTRNRYVLGQHVCPQAGRQCLRVVCCNAEVTTVHVADSSSELRSEESPLVSAERDAA